MAFEAYARFSSRLASCITRQDLQNLLELHLKYLFNFSQAAICYVQDGKVQGHRVGKVNLMGSASVDQLDDFEAELFSEKIPLVREISETETARGWCFDSGEQGVLLICLTTSNEQTFLYNASILRLLVESLSARFKQFNLMEALDEKNEKLNGALQTVRFQHEEIHALARRQGVELAEKTKDIRSKNEELQQIVKFNAHGVREPLSRIMGIMNVIKITNANMELQELQLLEEACNDLDQALCQIIVRAETKLKPHLS